MTLNNAPKNGLVMSGMTTAQTNVWRSLSPRATPLGRYSVSRSKASIRDRVAGAMRRLGSLLATLDMVDGCTRARAASSLRVTGIARTFALTFVSPVPNIGQSFVHSKSANAGPPAREGSNEHAKVPDGSCGRLRPDAGRLWRIRHHRHPISRHPDHDRRVRITYRRLLQ